MTTNNDTTVKTLPQLAERGNLKGLRLSDINSQLWPETWERWADGEREAAQVCARFMKWGREYLEGETRAAFLAVLPSYCLETARALWAWQVKYYGKRDA